MKNALPFDLSALTNDGPLYVKLEALLEQALAAGRLRPGDALPAERELAESAGISRVTVRKAVDRLVAQGRLVRKRGSGTFVAKTVPRLEQPLSRLTSFSQDMRLRGMNAGSRWISRGLCQPTSEETMMLGLPANASVARLVRLRTADDLPLALESTSLPEDVLPDPQSVSDSLYHALALRGTRLVRANERISAVILSSRESELLEVAPRSAALRIQRLAYLESGRAVELSTALYRSDAYDLVAELTLDQEDPQFPKGET